MYESEFELEAELEDLMAILAESDLAYEAEVINMAPITVTDPPLERAKDIIRREINRGVDDEYALTDAIFWDRHPEWNHKRLPNNASRALTEEWKRIRNRIVRVWRVPLLMSRSFVPK
jgi:hypothetical protein